jgi:transposase
MYFIGIDIAKRSHSLAVIDEGGEKVITRFEFANTSEGFLAMLAKLLSCGIDHRNSRVCIEATGHYGRCLHERLEDHGFEVCEVNPLQTSNFRKIQTIRKVKNDAVDALILAQWLLLKRPAVTKLSQPEMQELKSIARFRTFHSQIIGDCKRKVIAILDLTFPEYVGFFSDTFGKTSLAVLSRYPSASALSRARTDALARLLHQNSKGRIGYEQAVALKELAKSSFGTESAIQAHTIALTQLLAQIELYRAQTKALDRKATELLAAINTQIRTIPGIGVVCATVILGEIGDIERFSRPASLVAYAGLDPSVFESGEFTGTKNHLSKRGSRYLRWALWIAADSARRFDPVLCAYYQKKRSEGKCHKVAISAVARKLCNIIYAILKSNTPYVCPIG